MFRREITGLIVEDLDEAVEPAEKLRLISRDGCRAQFEQPFSARRMARRYAAVYEGLVRDAHARRQGAPNLFAVAIALAGPAG